MKKYSRFATAALASAMTFSAMGMAVFATTEGNEGEVEVTKTVKVRENAPKPKTDFEFTISKLENNTTVVMRDENGNEIKDENNQSQTQPVLVGPDDGLVFTDNKDTISFTPTANQVDTPEEKTEDGKKYYVYSDSDQVKLKVNTDVFDKKDDNGNYVYAPGIYRYKVAEEKGSYDGMEYDGTAYWVDIYLYTEEGTDGKDVRKYRLVASTDGSMEKHDVVFVNDFSKDSTNPDNPDNPDKGTREVLLTKRVTGNQGDKNHQFKFNFTVTANTDKSLGEGEKLTSGEVYNYIIGTVNESGVFTPDSSSTMKVAQSGESNEVYLKNGQAVKIYGVSPNDKVVTDETDENNNDNGYTTTVGSASKEYSEKSEDGDSTVLKTDTGTSGTLDSTIKADTTITWTNNKSVTTPAGVLLTAAPYAAVVALGGVFAGLFFRRKRED